MDPTEKPRIVTTGVVRQATTGISPESSSLNGFDPSRSPAPSLSTSIDKDELLRMYRLMLLIRRFEETCGQHYSLGNIRGFLHLYIGQEATGIGAITPLEARDYIVTSLPAITGTHWRVGWTQIASWLRCSASGQG